MNAPRELAAILDRWKLVSKGSTVSSVHGGDEPRAWAEHVRAMDLVAEVTRLLNSMEREGEATEHYRRSEVEWVKAVIVPNHVWTDVLPHNVSLVQQWTIDQLLGLGDLVARDNRTYPIDPAGRVQSASALEELLALISDPDALPISDAQRRYVFELISSVRKLLDEANAFETVDLARHINELVGFLSSIADSLDETGATDRASKLRDLGRKVRPFLIGGGALALGTLDAATNVATITTILGN